MPDIVHLKLHCLLLVSMFSMVAAPLAPAKAEEVKAPPKNEPVTDAQVVASMKKAIDFLLASRKGDNLDPPVSKENKNLENNYGGATALAAYALLHAGHSLLDEPEYASRLHFRSKDMTPIIEFLTKLEPKGTYVTSLMAAALTTTPRKLDRNDPIHSALQRCHTYILNGMGDDGGYNYMAWPNSKANRFGATVTATPEEIIADLKAAKTKAAVLRKELRPIAPARLEADLKAYQAYFMALDELCTLIIRARNVALSRDSSATLKMLRGELIQYLEEMERVIKSQDAAKQPPVTEDQQRTVAKWKALLSDFNTPPQKVKDDHSFSPWGDLSNSQYGALGAWALAEHGFEIPNRYWEISDTFWRKLQIPDGSWPYYVSRGDEKKTAPTMVPAGIASLFITSEFIDTELRSQPKPDPALEAGLAWLNQNFSLDPNKRFGKVGNDGWPMYTYHAYGIERVGLASGLKFFGTVNWYEEGARQLMAIQNANGSWSGSHGDVPNTSYALLFLARGRNAVAFNKLQYDGWWNSRPRDNANITRWMSKNTEKPINWQVVNLQTDPQDWLDAPVLLITGGRDPQFKPEDIAKLRAYIEAGGMIFSTADSNNGEFTAAMQRVATEVVNRKYEIRELPSDHALFSGELFAPIKSPPRILGMSNGVREVWIHSTVDLGASWQMRRYATAEHFNLPTNLFFYATGRGSLRAKLASLQILPAKAASVRTLTMARLDHPGNADPEPGAWRRMAKIAASEFQTDLKVIENLSIEKLDAKEYKLAHMTGSTAFTLNDKQTAALSNYIKAGGTLFVDAAGGSSAFNDAVRTMLDKAFPGEALQAIESQDPLINGKLTDGVDVTTVEFRKFARTKLGRQDKAELVGIKRDGRWAVIYAPHDITSGLLGTNTWGIVGYTADSAKSIARNVLLYAVGEKVVGGGNQ